MDIALEKGMYVLRTQRTDEWPYAVAVPVAGPFEDLRKVTEAFLNYDAMTGAGEVKIRRWDGEKWRAV